MIGGFDYAEAEELAKRHGDTWEGARCVATITRCALGPISPRRCARPAQRGAFCLVCAAERARVKNDRGRR